MIRVSAAGSIGRYEWKRDIRTNIFVLVLKSNIIENCVV